MNGFEDEYDCVCGYVVRREALSLGRLPQLSRLRMAI